MAPPYPYYSMILLYSPKHSPGPNINDHQPRGQTNTQTSRPGLGRAALCPMDGYHGHTFYQPPPRGHGLFVPKPRARVKQQR